MTAEEAIRWQESFKKTYKGYPKDVDKACNMAIKALENQNKFESVIRTAEELNPYNVAGQPHTADKYNEGWQDAVDFIERNMEYEDEVN